MRLTTRLGRVLVAGLAISIAMAGGVVAGEPGDERPDRNISAEATTSSESGDPPPPPPACWWEQQPAGATDRAQEQGFWRRIDGGEHYDDVLVFLEAGTLRRTFTSTQTTFVLLMRVCSDPSDDRAGGRRWVEVGPPNPTVYWDELTERVTRRVPLPEPDLGFEAGPDGVVDIAVRVGLWIAVENADDVVARAEPAPGVWAETRARLDRIEFDTGTGVTVVDGCAGAGTPLPVTGVDTVEQGRCGYTYTRVEELGEHQATVRAIWVVTSAASTGATQRRPDIVLETPIAIDVFEIQTVGTG